VGSELELNALHNQSSVSLMAHLADLHIHWLNWNAQFGASNIRM